MQHLADPAPAPAAVETVTGAEQQLAAAGLGVAIRRSGGRLYAGGVNAVLPAGPCADEATLAVLARSRAAGLRASLHLPIEPGQDLELAADEVEAVVAAASPVPQLSLPRGDGPGARDLRSRLTRITAPVRGFLILDPARGGSLPERISARSWQTLRDALSRPGSWLPAMQAGVRSPCPLLAAETSTTVLPGTAIAAPAHTAWLPLVLDLLRFCDSRGRIDRARLAGALDAAVESGNRLFDRLSWCSPQQAEDARLNRRLAVCVVGIGDLVVLRRADPSSLACLRELHGLLGELHDGLWRRSMRLAAADGAAPVLVERQPSARWRDTAHRQDWARRWRQAVDEVQVRNRNLLALSPYAVLPRHTRAGAAFADLLPLLGHADALSFAAPRLRVDWPDADFQFFCARLRAEVQRLNAVSFVAAGA